MIAGFIIPPELGCEPLAGPAAFGAVVSSGELSCVSPSVMSRHPSKPFSQNHKARSSARYC
jgi:hypothetical protein